MPSNKVRKQILTDIKTDSEKNKENTMIFTPDTNPTKIEMNSNTLISDDNFTKTMKLFQEMPLNVDQQRFEERGKNN
jgi:hypothetical protein